MKKYLLSLFLASLAILAYGTTWTITNMGYTFSPVSLTILQGDTIVFNLENIHNVQQVSLTTWDENGTTPLPEGFSLPLGGGILFTDDMTEGTHFYVCQPHASMGMKGMIHVLTLGETTGTSEERAASAMLVYPNPSSGLIHLSLNGNASIESSEVVVFDVQGNKVDANTLTNGNSGQLDLTNVAKGIYFIRFRYEGEMYTRKIVTH